MVKLELKRGTTGTLKGYNWNIKGVTGTLKGYNWNIKGYNWNFKGVQLEH